MFSMGLGEKKLTILLRVSSKSSKKMKGNFYNSWFAILVLNYFQATDRLYKRPIRKVTNLMTPMLIPTSEFTVD